MSEPLNPGWIAPRIVHHVTEEVAFRSAFVAGENPKAPHAVVYAKTPEETVAVGAVVAASFDLRDACAAVLNAFAYGKDNAPPWFAQVREAMTKAKGGVS